MTRLPENTRKRTVQIRQTVYRGNAGFLVIEHAGQFFGARIFTTTRASAERIRAKVRRGEQTTLADFSKNALEVAP